MTLGVGRLGRRPSPTTPGIGPDPTPLSTVLLRYIRRAMVALRLPSLRASGIAALLALVLASGPGAAAAASTPAPSGDELLLLAREAARKKDKTRLGQLRAQMPSDHPLAMWPDYWELNARVPEAQQPELEAFYARWPGTYVEDRLRNDWLLELGRRRDWANFRAELPRYRMNDDREVGCYALLLQHQAAEDVKAAARTAWYAQRDLDDGCHLLASTLAESRQFTGADIWRKIRLSAEFNRPRAARAAAALLGPAPAAAVAEVLDNPARFLHRRIATPSVLQRELAVLALIRLAAADPEAAAAELAGGWQRQLGADQSALAWVVAGKHAALKQLPQAVDYVQQAWRLQREHGHAPQWSDEALAWGARAVLRSAPLNRERWALVAQNIDAMSADEQKDPAWAYWRARSLQTRSRSGPGGDTEREQARVQLEGLSRTLGFYGHLAAHDLNLPHALPPLPAALSESELAAAQARPGLRRGLQMAAIGLRDEGRREWNFTLRGMSDRELLAAAQMACNASDWQLCINTSERTRAEVDVRQRYPMPFANEIVARAQERGLDPAFVFGLIRQETRFMATLRSSAGALGLMQLMPATARWTARKLGLDLRAEQVTDVDLNLRLGTTYLKLVLDDFAGSQPLAAAAYNAGPGRPRRWREGPVLDAAAWAETIPFNETRDYVKKVLSNAAVYSTLLAGANPMPLRHRLGNTIGPREPGTGGGDRELP